MHKKALASALFLFSGVTRGQPVPFLPDGTFDNLVAGTAPDCGIPAGSWHFPPSLPNCEPYPGAYSIVSTGDFDPSRSGRSLHVAIANRLESEGYHLANVLSSPITPTSGETIRCTWEVFVRQGQSGNQPLGVYIGADMGGGGHSTEFDRATQMAWWGDGRLTVRTPTGPLTVVGAYPRDAWQSVRVDIHLGTQTWDFSWAPSGQPLQLLASNLTFCSTAFPFTAIDRWSVAHWDENGTFISDCYIDNVTMGLLCYANCDGSTAAPILNINDFFCFLNTFAAGSSNANCDASTVVPILNVNDFTCFLNRFAAGCL